MANLQKTQYLSGHYRLLLPEIRFAKTKAIPLKNSSAPLKNLKAAKTVDSEFDSELGQTTLQNIPA